MWEWPALLLATLFGSVVARWWQGRRGAEIGRSEWGTDVAVAAVLFVGSSWYFREVHATTNPMWHSDGQDNDSYLSALSALKYGPMRGVWPNNRYYLYPWLAVQFCEWTGMALWRAAAVVSLLTSAAVVPAVYTFARTIAVRPVAVAASLVIVPLQSHLVMLGTPTDYPLASGLYVASVAAMVMAIRDGGWPRHLAAGLALGGYLATTPKSFPLLFLGFIAIFGARLLRPRGALPDLTAFVTPVVVAWVGFWALDVQPAPLEYHMYQMQHDNQQLDLTQPFPNLGWTPGGETSPGYWVPGTVKALIKIPQVLGYILLVPLRHTSVADRLDLLLPNLALELGYPSIPWLTLATLLIPAAVVLRGRDRSSNALGALAMFGFTAAHLWGLTSGVYSPRYVQPVVLTIPAMLLAIAAIPARNISFPGAYLAWLPMFAGVAYLLGPSQGDLGRASVERWRSFTPPEDWHVAQISILRTLIRPGDVVVQATDSRNVILPLLDGLGVSYQDDRMTAVPGGSWLRVEPSESARRFLVFDCLIWAHGEGTYTGVRQIMDAQPERFVRISRCIYQDFQPTTEFEVFLPTVPAGVEP